MRIYIHLQVFILPAAEAKHKPYKLHIYILYIMLANYICGGQAIVLAAQMISFICWGRKDSGSKDVG